MTASPYTINYRGYSIDPVEDSNESGNWDPCPVDQATVFRIYPPDIDAPCLEVEAYTLETAKAVIDIELVQ